MDGTRWKVSFTPRQISRLDRRFHFAKQHTLRGETARIGGPGMFAVRKLN